MELKLGQTVMCKDNQDVEAHVAKNEFYTVENVSHRGALIQVSGVQIPLASVRFTPIKLVPPVTEADHASN